jgi:hypothetical protein
MSRLRAPARVTELDDHVRGMETGPGAPAPPVAVDRSGSGDRQQPIHPQTHAWLVAEGPEDLQEHLVQDVLRLDVITHRPTQERQHLRPVAAIQLGYLVGGSASLCRVGLVRWCIRHAR